MRRGRLGGDTDTRTHVGSAPGLARGGVGGGRLGVGGVVGQLWGSNGPQGKPHWSGPKSWCGAGGAGPPAMGQRWSPTAPR